jgi:hypothetical protein
MYATLNQFEELSIANLNKVLPWVDKIVVCPDNLELDFNKYIDTTYTVVRLPRRFFKSPQTYNHLLRSRFFFELFAQYEYMLMHHLDAFVFRDELEYWCEMGYDYIGAPIYYYDGTIAPSTFACIGNGGFSMHKISSSLKVLNTFKTVYRLEDLFEWYSKYSFKGKISHMFTFLKMLVGVGRNSHHLLNTSHINEDVFWGMHVPRAFDWYRIPSFDESYRFSMEYNCKELLEKNSGKLPFGCHGWFKGDFLSFWKPIILKG